MTEEQWQRKMEFIVEQQAHITASLQQHDEYWKRVEEERVRDRPRLKELEQSFKRLVELAEISESRLDDLESRSTKLETGSTVLETSMAALAAAQARADEAQAHADERMSALAVTGAHADERLSALAVTQAHADERLSALAVAQAHADERVSALIDIIIEGRNGPS